MAIDISSAYSSSNSIDQLVNMYMRIEAQPKYKAESKRATLESRKTVLSDLDSKLSAVKTKADRLTDTLTDYFATKKTTSSNTDKFTATASTSATLGKHSFTVERLAAADTRVSQQYTDSSSSFTGFLSDETFSITVAHPTDADASNRVAISVTATAASLAKTNDEALADIANAINTAMVNAVTADTIENDEIVHASVVTEESGKSRLVLNSDKSGYTNRMTFTDSANSLLSALEVSASYDAATDSNSDKGGGYMTSVGTSVTDSLLNSKFTVDGLTFYRDENQVTDALTGVTISFLNTFATAETLTVTPDIDGVKTEIQGYLDAYNNSLTFLKDKAQMDPETKRRGILANDSIYRQLSSEMRSKTNATVTTNSATYTSLFSIGIEASSSGSLSIADLDKFTLALETNSQNISDVFDAADGIATNMKSYLDNFVKVGGTIDSSKENVDNSVIQINDTIKRMDERLAKREIQLKKQFAEMQDAMSRLSQQQSFWGQVGRSF